MAGNNPTIRIDGDLSGLNKAMDEFRRKALEVSKDLNGAKVSIDPSKAKQDLKEIEKSVESLHSTLEKALGGDIGAGSMDKLKGDFETAVSQVKELTQVVSQIGGKGSIGLDRSVSSVRALVQELEKAQRLQAALSRQGHSVTTGQAGEMEREFQRRVGLGGRGTRQLKKFGNLGNVVSNWRDLSPMSEVDARRQQRDLLSSFGVAGSSVHQPAAPTVPHVGKRPQSFAQFATTSAIHAGRGVVSAATPNTGVGGSIFQSAASAASATEGGMLSGAGLARLAAGGGFAALAYGGIKAVGAIHSKIHSSEEEGTAYADLRRSTNSPESFDNLRTSVRGASTALSLSYADGASLAHRYSSEAGVDKMTGESLRSELAAGGGFARSMGLAPEAGVGMAGTLRHNKVANSAMELKRVGLMIGEGIAKAGVFSKADDVLTAVTNFTSAATRAALAPANVQGFVGGMSTLMGSSAGLDPQMAASMLGKADSAIRSNGGEAFSNLLLGAAQKDMQGINAMDMGFLRDGGAFGNAESAFGENSQAYKSAMARGDTASAAHFKGLAKSGGSKLNIDRVMDGLDSSSHGSDAMRTNLKAMGYSDTEAAAMMTARAKHGSFGAAASSLGHLGVDPSKMSDTSMKGIMSVAYGTDEDRQKQAKYLRGLGGSAALNGAESKMLDSAMASKDQDKIKEALIKLTSSRDMESTEGDESRRNAANLDNIASEIASKLIPMTNAIREGVVSLATRFGGYKDTYGNSEKSSKALQEKLTAAGSNEAARSKAIGSIKAHIAANPDDYSPEYKAKIDKMFDDSLVSNTASEVGQGASGKRGLGTGNSVTPSNLEAARAKQIAAASPYDDIFKRAGEKYGVDWKDLKQIGVQESGLRPSISHANNNGTVDHGIMQLNSRYDEERGVSNPNDPEQNINAGAAVWARALRDAKGDVRGAFRRYNGSGPQAENYANNAMRLRNLSRGGDTPSTNIPTMAGGENGESMIFGKKKIPDWMAQKNGQSQNFNVNGSFLVDLKDLATGRQLAAPIQQSFSSGPRPTGARL